MEYLVGIDIGTTALKGVAFSPEGVVLYSWAEEYPLLHPAADRSEIDPARIFTAFTLVVENILQTFSGRPPDFLSFSAAMHSLLAVDAQGRPLSRFWVWADNRAAREAEELHRSGEAMPVYLRTGVPVHPMSPFCKLLWWRKNLPEEYARVSKFIGIKEYLFFRLFGVYVVDISVASATGLLGLDSADWDPEMLARTGLTRERLSGVVPVGEIFHGTSLFPALADTPFVIGGSDGAMANDGTIGSGSGALVVSIGTSAAARFTVKEKQLDPDMACFCYNLRAGEFLLGGAGNNGAVVLQWLREKVLQSKLSLPALLETARAVAPGAGGLVFLPYILGERAPLWNPQAKGVWFGLSAETDQAAMVRATMEAVICCVFAMSRPVVARQAPEKIFVTGGFARSELWVQMLADMFDLPVIVAATVENAAWGAVLTGAAATRYALPGTPGELPVEKRVTPLAGNVPVYARLFQRFQQLNRWLLPAFTESFSGPGPENRS